MRSFKKILSVIVLFLFIACCNTSCNVTPISLHEARTIVDEADSIRALGQLYNDSLRIADATHTLSHYRFILPNQYAHANYHYGRLLKDLRCDYVSSMQCFLEIVHSHTSDHAIKARAYSNMATICHRGGDYLLSYKMYKLAAKEFLSTQDSTNYYFALYEIAWELAELKQKEETMYLLRLIRQECADELVLTYALMTEAQLYKNIGSYDSAIYYINLIPEIFLSHTSLSIKAQSFWSIGNIDSALIYANAVLEIPGCPVEGIYNMLYLLTYSDTTINEQDFRLLSERRSDIEIAVLDPLHQQTALAIDLLKKDIEAMPSYIYILIIFLIFSIIIYLIWWEYQRIRKHREQVHREINAKKQELILFTEKELLRQEAIRNQQHELDKQNNILQQEGELLKKQYREIGKQIEKQIELNSSLLCYSDNWQTELFWRDYSQLCIRADALFNMLASKLINQSNLNEKEVRLCILVLIDRWKDKELAEILYYGDKSIRSMKRYVALKLGTNSAKLRSVLMKIAIGILDD